MSRPPRTTRRQAAVPPEIIDAPEPIRRHVKKMIDLAHSKARLRLAVSQDLFSSHDVDVGTALLMRTLAAEPGIRDRRRVLDLGCGYGPLGLLLAAWNPEAQVHCVDRDALAVAFTSFNAEHNELGYVHAYPSLGYDDVPESGFDLIVSNIPAKAGPEVIRQLVLDARQKSTPDGLVAVVVIDRIAPVVAQALTEPGITSTLTKASRGYTCFHYRFDDVGAEPVAAFVRGDYVRQSSRVRLGHESLPMTTAWGLPEFDSTDFATDLAAQFLDSLPVGPTLLISPGQGHLPALLAQRGASRLVLNDRDLLALRVSAANTPAAVEVEPVLLADPEPVDRGCESGVVILRDPQAQATNLQAVRAAYGSLSPGALLVVSGASTPVTRALDGCGADASARRRRGGVSAALVRVRAQSGGSGTAD